ncbi:MAG: ATP-dependent RNA helicase HrpA [Gammaproteobacteria bacterium]
MEARRAGLPSPQFPEELPVSQRREEIAEAIRGHQVVVLCGETGSGKTTQLPKICLSLGRGTRGWIGHTQPRRIAARNIAARIAEELGGELGEMVGYKVRFADRVRRDGYVKLMTDGILLAETQSDPLLAAYDTLIIDEAHERSLNIDFLLGYLKRLLPKRPDLKLIITSATIDPERFSRHFDDAPILTVSGRTYPVEIRYRPVVGEDQEERDRDLTQAILDAVDEVSRIDRHGDILVFLPGEREIRETAEALRKHHPPGTEIVPLYARLSVTEQQRVFKPHTGQRIVLATNVAETSLTVPGIRFVIDPGLARISRYSYRTQVLRLPVEPVSQASANQRAGRCGRVSAGVCVRLYSEEDFAGRPEFTEPEIRRTNLASVILQMKALRLGEIERFPFVDPPDGRYVRDGVRLLEELGALTPSGELTETGRRLARLPVDPRIGRMLLEAERERCLDEVLTIAAALSVQDPRERPAEAPQAADESHEEFRDRRSDFLSFLRLWRWYEEQRRHLSQNQLRKLLKRRHLSYLRLREWRDVRQQLHHLVADLGLRINTDEAGYDAIHRALLSGLLGNIALRDEKNEYTGARGNRLMLWPGSALFSRGARWIVAAELVETSRVYARTVAAIQPEWVERLAGARVKRRYSEPHWEKRPARVVAFEQVSLYGLPIVARRKVHFGPIDPKLAREIFIREALVRGEWKCRLPFHEHNRRLIAEVEEIEHRQRRRDVLSDEEVLFEFFDRQIPEDVYSGKRFERWYRNAAAARPDLLRLTKAVLMQRPESASEEDYPGSIEVCEGLHLPLRYHFDPGHHCDGVTVVVPAAALNQVEGQRLEWLVPGLLEEKIAALIKSLPKALRRNFVPAPDYARACAAALTHGEGRLLPALARQLKRMTGVDVHEEAWNLDKIPEHLVMNVSVVDANGSEVARGRDLARLRETLTEQTQSHFEALPTTRWERSGIVSWDFGDLPEQVDLEVAGAPVQAYPALCDEGDSVAIRLLDSRRKAEEVHRRGLRRLILLSLPQQARYLRKNLPDFETMALHYTSVGSAEALREDLTAAVIDRAFQLPETRLCREAEFRHLLDSGRGRMMAVANELCRVVGEALGGFHRLQRQLKGSLSPQRLAAAREIQQQLRELLFPGFVSQVPGEWLAHYPRYLKAAELRWQKLDGNPGRDARNAGMVAAWWARYVQIRERGRGEEREPDALLFRWMIEEFRVSLFAQELGTCMPVSAERLEKQWRRARG